MNCFSDLLSKGMTCNATGSGVGSTAQGFYPCYNSFAQGFGPSTFQLSTQDYGVFVQDDWKATPRLTKPARSVSYLGALGRELPNYLNLNLNPANTYNFNYVVGGTNGNCGPLACGSIVPVEVYSNRTQTDPTKPSVYTYNTRRIQPLAPTTELISNINSSYHALTGEVQKRASGILSFDANYTWAHALDFNQNASTQASTNGWFDPFGDARANYGNSNNNVPQRVVGWAILNSPRLSTDSALKYLANGWSLKPLFQMQSGLPYSLTVTGPSRTSATSKAASKPIAPAWAAPASATSLPSAAIPSATHA